MSRTGDACCDQVSNILASLPSRNCSRYRTCRSIIAEVMRREKGRIGKYAQNHVGVLLEIRGFAPQFPRIIWEYSRNIGQFRPGELWGTCLGYLNSACDTGLYLISNKLFSFRTPSDNLKHPYSLDPTPLPTAPSYFSRGPSNRTPFGQLRFT